MAQRILGARGEYRKQEAQRSRDSVNLADRFQHLKSLTVDLEFYNPEGVTRNSRLKYTVDLDNAKSVFRFDCVNGECVGGDFDLSEELASAVTEQRTTAVGDKCCQGWRGKSTIDRIHCHKILRYTLSLAY